MASIRIYFERAKFYPSQGGGLPDYMYGRRPRPEGPRAGVEFLANGAATAGGKFKIRYNLRVDTSIVSTEMPYNVPASHTRDYRVQKG